MIITKQNNNGTIIIRKNQPIQFQLEEHSSAGYLWDFSVFDHPNVLTLTDENISPSNFVGSSCIRTVKIIISESNTYFFNIKERRPWHSTDVISTFSIIIVVVEAL